MTIINLEDHNLIDQFIFFNEKINNINVLSAKYNRKYICNICNLEFRLFVTYIQRNI
jgi:hypothetical protein